MYSTLYSPQPSHTVFEPYVDLTVSGVPSESENSGSGQDTFVPSLPAAVVIFAGHITRSGCFISVEDNTHQETYKRASVPVPIDKCNIITSVTKPRCKVEACALANLMLNGCFKLNYKGLHHYGGTVHIVLIMFKQINYVSYYDAYSTVVD